MNIDYNYIKQKHLEGQNTEYTHMLVLVDPSSENLFNIYIQRDNITFEVLHNFLTERKYDYIMLFSLKHDIDKQIDFVLEEIKDHEKEKVSLDTPVLKFFI